MPAWQLLCVCLVPALELAYVGLFSLQGEGRGRGERCGVFMCVCVEGGRGGGGAGREG